MASGLLQKFDAGRIYDLAIYDLPFAIYVGYVRRSIGIKKVRTPKRPHLVSCNQERLFSDFNDVSDFLLSIVQPVANLLVVQD